MTNAKREPTPCGGTTNIRRAHPADADIIASFNQAMAAETERKTLDTRTALDGVEAALADSDRALYFVAEMDGEVVGQTMVTTEWSDWRNGWFWWIQSVYVDPAHRRRGIFSSLYDHIRKSARSTPDVCGLRLYVHDQNERAIQAYRKLGMSVTPYLLCEEEWPSDGCRAS
jgi:ribosomal protein S18 acetylase RimI-like enzyme